MPGAIVSKILDTVLNLMVETCLKKNMYVFFMFLKLITDDANITSVSKNVLNFCTFLRYNGIIPNMINFEC